MSAARNAAIRKSDGQYIAFIDDDDVWLPDKLEKQVACFWDFKIQSNIELGLVYTGLDNMDEQGRHVCDVFYKVSRNDYAKFVFQNFIGTPSCVMVPRKVLEDVGLFDERTSGVSDYDLWLRIMRKYEVAYVDGCLTRYRNRPSSLSKNAAVMIADYDRILEKILSEDVKSGLIAAGSTKELVSYYGKRAAFLWKNAAYDELFVRNNRVLFRKYMRNSFSRDRQFSGLTVLAYYMLSFFAPAGFFKWLEAHKPKRVFKSPDIASPLKDLRLSDLDEIFFGFTGKIRGINCL